MSREEDEFWEYVARGLQLDRAHFPRAVSPMYASLIGVIGDGMRRASEEFLVPMGCPLHMGVPRPPSFAAFRHQVRRFVQYVQNGNLRHTLEKWRDKWLPQLLNDLESLRARDIRVLTDEELLAYLDEIIQTFARYNVMHIKLHLAMLYYIGKFKRICKEMLGYNDLESCRLLSGLENKTVEANSELAKLASYVKKSSELMRLIEENVPEDAMRKMKRIDPEFKRWIDEYLDQYGNRIIDSFDVKDITVRESPHFLVKLIKDYIEIDYDPEREFEKKKRNREQAVKEALARITGYKDRQSFRNALELAELAYPVSEEHYFYMDQTFPALSRYALLEVGDRLASKGAIGSRNDMFFLTYDEAREALKSKSLRLHELVESRKVDFRRRRSSRPLMGIPPPPQDIPSFDGLPEEVRDLTSMMIDEARIPPGDEPRALKMRKVLRGRAASPGIFLGQAKIVLSQADFGKVKPGDVLVCPTTTAAWTVLFLKVSALVTDSGGLLSHAAIVAREYGIPAVVNTDNGTTSIRDGQTVKVDGNQGVVYLQ